MSKEIIKDGLGRIVNRDTDRVYFVQLQKQTENVNSFFKEIKKEIDKNGFFKLNKNQPLDTKHSVKVRINKNIRVACTSVPQHFSILKKVLTNPPNDTLEKDEWKTLYYCGYSGVFNPSENFIRFNDINGISFIGYEFKL